MGDVRRIMLELWTSNLADDNVLRNCITQYMGTRVPPPSAAQRPDDIEDTFKVAMSVRGVAVDPVYGARTGLAEGQAGYMGPAWRKPDDIQVPTAQELRAARRIKLKTRTKEEKAKFAFWNAMSKMARIVTEVLEFDNRIDSDDIASHAVGIYHSAVRAHGDSKIKPSVAKAMHFLAVVYAMGASLPPAYRRTFTLDQLEATYVRVVDRLKRRIDIVERNPAVAHKRFTAALKLFKDLPLVSSDAPDARPIERFRGVMPSALYTEAEARVGNETHMPFVAGTVFAILSTRARDYMKENKITQLKLAELAGITPQLLARNVPA